MHSKIQNSINATAFGDAWGNRTEFYRHEDILRMNPSFPNQALVTDDTQMSLYALETVLENKELFDQYNITPTASLRDQIRICFADAFTVWLHDPDNNRAPGNTCLKALRSYEDFRNNGSVLTGAEGVIRESKGCGANMRAMWLGLLPYSSVTIMDLAVVQSETTHGHSLALAAAAITAVAVHEIVHDAVKPSKDGSLIRHMTRLASDVRMNENVASWSADFEEGITDLVTILNDGYESYQNLSPNMNEDICLLFGEGWVAEEALMNALAATDYYADNIELGLKRLVYSSGDSDSIAAIGGAMLGAANYAEDPMPENWFSLIEPRYQKELTNVTDKLKEINN